MLSNLKLFLFLSFTVISLFFSLSLFSFSARVCPDPGPLGALLILTRHRDHRQTFVIITKCYGSLMSLYLCTY